MNKDSTCKPVQYNFGLINEKVFKSHWWGCVGKILNKKKHMYLKDIKYGLKINSIRFLRHT